MENIKSGIIPIAALVGGITVMINTFNLGDIALQLQPSIVTEPVPGSSVYGAELVILAHNSSRTYSNLAQKPTLEHLADANIANVRQFGRLFQVAPDLGTNAWTSITQYIQGSTELMTILTDYKAHTDADGISAIENTAGNLVRRVHTLECAMEYGFSSDRVFNNLQRDYSMTTNPVPKK